MNLKLIYETAYPTQTPFIELHKSIFDLNYATILLGAIDEIKRKPKTVSFIGLFLYYLDKAGLNLNDMEFCFEQNKKFIRNSQYKIDQFLYENYCDNEIFKSVNDLKRSTPALLKYMKQVPEDASNHDESNVSYSMFLMSTVFFSELTKILTINTQNNTIIDTEAGTKFSEFLNKFNSLENRLANFTDVVAEIVDKENVTQKQILGIMNKMINTCTSEKLETAKTLYNEWYIRETQPLPKLSTLTDNQDPVNNITKLPDFVIGQDDAINRIMDRLMGAYIGFQSDKEPVASFLLTGPTGVGKTETAKAIANLCYNGKIFTVDMASFKNDSDVSRLLGGSPNYVGYNDTNEFCDFIEKNPKCVLLFDEIDKAHQGCLDLLMRMVDEGEFINAKGKVISLHDAVIICTTNMSQNKTSIVGFGSTAKTEELMAGDFGFKKEMLGRFNEVIEYKKLTKEACKQIAEKYFLKKCIENFQAKNADKKIKLKYDDALLEKILKDANTDFFGARDLKKSIQVNFITPISIYIIKNKPENVTITVGINGIEIEDSNQTSTKQASLKKNKGLSK